MSEEEDRARYRYLQLKQKASMGIVSQPQQEIPSDESTFSKAVNWPERKSSEGLGMIANAIPEGEITGNLPADLIRGTPRIAANTVAQVAPGFVSPLALATGAVSATLPTVAKGLAPVGKWAAGVAEDWSGVKPGALSNAAKDATLLFAKGKKSAGPLYQEAQAEVPYEQTLFRGLTNHRDIVDKAVETIEGGGKLEPQEALIARKSLDKIKKTFSDDAFAYYRNTLDSIAKSNESIAKADPAYVRGMQAESLRKVFPTNVGGRASPMKVGEAGWLGHMLGAPGKMLAAGTSPIVQGTVATVGGLAGRLASNPRLAMAVQQFVDDYYKRNQP